MKKKSKAQQTPKPQPAPAPNPAHKQDFDGLLDMAIAPPKKPRS